MTTSDCFVTLVGLKSHTDPANPEPFRDALPPPRPGHYWAPTVERFAKERDLSIRYPIDNLTPDIVIDAPDLKALLVDAYGENHPFVFWAWRYLSERCQYHVQAEDF